MKCNEIQEKILKGNILTAEEELHLLGCKACQEYSGLCLEVLGQPSVPLLLDEAIQQSAADAARRGPLRRHGIHRWLYGGVAAVAMLVAGICWSYKITRENIQVAQSSKKLTHENMLLILAEQSESLEAIENELTATSAVCLY